MDFIIHGTTHSLTQYSFNPTPETGDGLVAAVQLDGDAGVAAGGGKWAAPWMVAVNLPAMILHAPYVRSFEGFHRPWSHLEQLLEDVNVREFALGSWYIVTGHVPAPTGS